MKDPIISRLLAAQPFNTSFFHTSDTPLQLCVFLPLPFTMRSSLPVLQYETQASFPFAQSLLPVQLSSSDQILLRGSFRFIRFSPACGAFSAFQIEILFLSLLPPEYPRAVLCGIRSRQELPMH